MAGATGVGGDGSCRSEMGLPSSFLSSTSLQVRLVAGSSYIRTPTELRGEIRAAGQRAWAS